MTTVNTNNSSVVLLEKEYDGNNIIDIEEGIYWAIEDAKLPSYPHGILKGTFKVVLTWTNEE